jgi:hypothetical protein
MIEQSLAPDQGLRERSSTWQGHLSHNQYDIETDCEFWNAFLFTEIKIKPARI